jgi:alginate O-acetyltransferase complex protein AlgI
MLFNTLQFLVFFLLVYGVYIHMRHRTQNRWLLMASYIFYASWDWRFLSLILISTFVDYHCALQIDRSQDERQRRLFLISSVVFNLAVLGIFKYFNFFMDNLQGLLSLMNIQLNTLDVNIILPMGISFYTFQTMSYTIDVYRRELRATGQFWDFALYVAFFPQLVAGPIERAKRLIPQILQPRKIQLEQFYQGVFLTFWGLFLKVYIADNLANVVDPVFAGSQPYNGVEVLLACYAFTFQIYCDFAGYSHIARGLAKMMGFELMLNFNLPFFSQNIQEYWNRWHISLSSWLRDYFYIPLFRWMRNIKGNMRLYTALVITMVLIGFWHGAAWNYVVFGVYYGVLLALYVFLRGKVLYKIQPQNPVLIHMWTGTKIVFNFHLVVIGMMIFRVHDVPQIGHLLSAMVLDFSMSAQVPVMLFKMVSFLWLLIAVQLIQFKTNDLMWVYNAAWPVKTAFYVVCYYLILIYGITNAQEFIYFQF